MDIPTNSHLQHLQFHVSNLRREQLEHVLRAIPNVRYLSIQTCEANGLAVVNQYCRRLEFISYNAGPYLIPWMKLLGREERTTIGLSRDHRSSGRFGTKTAETLASEFLDVFPEGVPKWAPMSTCGIHHFRGFRRGYDLDSYPKILATVFRDDTSNIINISARFLSMRQADRATPLDILAY
ncbi:hypothetical protein BX666DRAFT_1874019 [Dichotomocladium elegans]|nr:hypothetical protein BX666DRAFT_1874019 [Dichotomocladium elegans]